MGVYYNYIDGYIMGMEVKKEKELCLNIYSCYRLIVLNVFNNVINKEPH